MRKWGVLITCLAVFTVFSLTTFSITNAYADNPGTLVRGPDHPGFPGFIVITAGDNDGIRKIELHYGNSVNDFYPAGCPQTATGMVPLVHQATGARLNKVVVIDCQNIGITKTAMQTTFTIGQTGNQTDISEGQTSEDGNCLTGYAVLGTEVAYHVQKLREFRDNEVLTTESGKVFMDTVHQYYYTFSPAVTEWEHQNPMFKELVRVAITPAIATFSLLTFVDPDSETELLSYMAGTILLNIGMYFVAPAFLIMKMSNRFRN